MRHTMRYTMRNPDSFQLYAESVRWAVSARLLRLDRDAHDLEVCTAEQAARPDECARRHRAGEIAAIDRIEVIIVGEVSHLVTVVIRSATRRSDDEEFL